MQAVTAVRAQSATRATAERDHPRNASLDGTHVQAVLARFASDSSPDALPERRRLAEQAVTLLSGTDQKRPGLAATVYFAYLSTLAESGDARALDQALSPRAYVSDQFAGLIEHHYAIWFRCSRAAMDGRLVLAERLAGEGHTLAVAARDVDAETVWAGQMAAIRWMQGRISEMEQVFLHARQADPGEPVWAAMVAWIWVHQGRKRAARGLLDSLPGIETFPRGRNYLAALALLAEVVAGIGTATENDELRSALLPYADRVVTMGLGVTSWGTVARHLALLARARNDYDEARRWYQSSIESCSVTGAQPWLARAQVELAQIDAEQGSRMRAVELAAESAAAARPLGLRYIEQQADRVLRRITTDDDRTHDEAAPDHTPAMSLPDVGPRPPVPNGLVAPGWAQSRTGRADAEPMRPQTDLRHARISVFGEFAVTYPDGTVAAWKSRKAATLLKMLVARRGALLARETAMDLLWPGENPDKLRNRLSVALTTVRRVLDPERQFPANHFLAANASTLRLDLGHLTVDVEAFFALAERARTAKASGADDAEPLLRQTVAAYTDDALADEPYAAWAEQLREQAHLVFFGASHELADLLADRGNHLDRAELYRGIIALDPYDLAAHDGLIDALAGLGASGRLAAAHAERHRRMAELGLSAS